MCIFRGLFNNYVINITLKLGTNRGLGLYVESDIQTAWEFATFTPIQYSDSHADTTSCNAKIHDRTGIPDWK